MVWHLHLHSDIPQVVNACQTLQRQYRNTRYYPHKHNRGLSRSWNDSLETAYGEGATVALLLNDDMQPQAGDLQRVAQAALDNPSAAIVKCRGYDNRTGIWRLMEYGFAAITRHGMKTIGYFDENIYPVYLEDTDWERRLQLSGEQVQVVNETTITHIGSKTINSVTGLRGKSDTWFHANKVYYARKWGINEDYPTPFNDPRYGLKISASERHNPYPEYQRKAGK